MRITKYAAVCLLVTVCLSTPALAAKADISLVIDRFVADQFPSAQSHLWIVNRTEWGSKDEVVVDLNTIVVTREDGGPTENRFLLLIVGGKLAAAQSVPLGAKIECEPDEVL